MGQGSSCGAISSAMTLHLAKHIFCWASAMHNHLCDQRNVIRYFKQKDTWGETSTFPWRQILLFKHIKPTNICRASRNNRENFWNHWVGHTPSPPAPGYSTLKTSAAFPETGFLAERRKYRNLRTSTCPVLAGSSARRFLQGDQRWLRRGARLLQPAQQGRQQLPRSAWQESERRLFSGQGAPSILEMHHVFQADPKQEHSKPNIGLILLRVF